jgi:tryptophan-rich sensory protein
MTDLSLPRPHGTNPRPVRPWVGVAAIVAGVVAVAVIGGLVTAGSVKTWYPGVPKPAWTPPDWVFGPVWTALYAMMAAAASVVWLSRDRTCCPLTAFWIQLGLNLLWSVFFFGLRSPLLGLIDICVLWVAIGVTVAQFFRASRLAGWLLVPYWLWVTFAAALNASIVLRGG